MGRFNIFDSDSIAAGMLAGWLLRNYCYMGGESGPNL